MSKKYSGNKARQYKVYVTKNGVFQSQQLPVIAQLSCRRGSAQAVAVRMRAAGEGVEKKNLLKNHNTKVVQKPTAPNYQGFLR